MKINQKHRGVWRKISSLLFVAVFALTLFLPVSADEMASNIGAETAALIATAFVTDNVQMNIGSTWTEDTEVSNVVTMYDTNGSTSAYSVEFETNGQSNGYVIVSAYVDVENLILEYADEAEPLYAEFGNIEGDTVVYTGLNGYFVENDDGTYQTLNGDDIKKVDIGNSTLQALRSPAHYAANRQTISGVESGRSLFVEIDGQIVYDPDGELTQNPGSAITPFGAGDVEITSPSAHADRYYQGPFYSYSYRNDWESYASFYSMDYLEALYTDFVVYNYGPTALTNFVQMFGDRFNMTNITSEYPHELYYDIVQIGIDDWCFFPSWGIDRDNLPQYFQDVLDYYDIYYNSGSIAAKVPTYDNVVYQLNNGGPFYLTTINHGYYGEHAVTVYGYIRLVSQSTGYYKSYVKVCDGYASSGRYIDMATIGTSSTGEMISWTW